MILLDRTFSRKEVADSLDGLVTAEERDEFLDYFACRVNIYFVYSELAQAGSPEKTLIASAGIRKTISLLVKSLSEMPINLASIASYEYDVRERANFDDLLYLLSEKLSGLDASLHFAELELGRSAQGSAGTKRMGRRPNERRDRFLVETIEKLRTFGLSETQAIKVAAAALCAAHVENRADVAEVGRLFRQARRRYSPTIFGEKSV